MTLFVGGPYHGKDLPVDPDCTASVRLPAEDRLAEFLALIDGDPHGTVNANWPFAYKLDRSTCPAFFRHVETCSTRATALRHARLLAH